MKNLERWNFWMKDFCSPQSFIDWGFYSMIAASLERRVYRGSEHKQLFPNLFTVVTGPAGSGKGMVIGEIANILKDKEMLHKPDINDAKDSNDPEEDFQPKNSYSRIKNMIIPVAPAATTLQELTRMMSKMAKPVWNVDETGKRRATLHSSIYFQLEELGSLIKTKGSEDIPTFLNEVYDCKPEYEYRTKHQGVDLIRKPCMNFFAGTTPEFLRRCFSTALLAEGFASRTVFVVADRHRFARYETPTFCSEQIEERKYIVQQVKALSKLQGLVTFSPEALEFSKYWWEVTHQKERANRHPRLEHYYARKNITHAKLSMAIHFSDSIEMTVGLPSAIEALRILDATEQTMHLALGVDSKNPLAQVTQDIYKFISNNEMAKKKQLATLFWESLPGGVDDIDKIIQHLLMAGKIREHEGMANTYLKREESNED